MQTFLSTTVIFLGKRPLRPEMALARWHDTWRHSQALQNPEARAARTRTATGHLSAHKRRRNRGLQGPRFVCPLVRKALFEWFVAMRYAIDWKAYDAHLRSRRQLKCLGRFPRSLLLSKVRQLLQDYTYECLINGVQPRTFKPTSKWFRRWEDDFGVSLRKPNRKYKVPKDLLESRVLLWFLIIARIRALCLEVHSYDPEMENWDQTPYHNNEVGSQNACTLGQQLQPTPAT